MPILDPSLPSPVARDVDPSREAFDALEAQIRAVPPERLVSVNVDPQAAASIAITAAPKIAGYRRTIAESLPKANLALIDDIMRRARATEQAEALFEVANAPKDGLAELVERATHMRSLLVSELTTLGRRGFFEASRLSELGTTRGSKGVGADLRRAVIMMREILPTLPTGGTLTTREELETAGKLAAAVLDTVAAREGAPARAAANALLRRQALTLLFEAYDEARRAITYIRWNDGDVNDIAPSLYGTRDGSGRRKDDAAQQPAPVAPLAQASLDRAATPGFGESELPPFGAV